MTPLYLQAVSARIEARVRLALWEQNPTPENEREMRDAVMNAESKDSLLSRFDPNGWRLYVTWCLG